jgi:hypothetical protein
MSIKACAPLVNVAQCWIRRRPKFATQQASPRPPLLGRPHGGEPGQCSVHGMEQHSFWRQVSTAARKGYPPAPCPTSLDNNNNRRHRKPPISQPVAAVTDSSYDDLFFRCFTSRDLSISYLIFLSSFHIPAALIFRRIVSARSISYAFICALFLFTPQLWTTASFNVGYN